MRKVLVFGNPLLKEDSLPLRLLPELQKRFPEIEFVEADPNDFDYTAELIIDTAVGIKDVKLIDDINKLEASKIFSMHEMDLGQTLKLMKAAGLIEKIRIIAVPSKISEEEALDKIEKILRSI